jgi:hypothetical protein
MLMHLQYHHWLEYDQLKIKDAPCKPTGGQGTIGEFFHHQEPFAPESEVEESD